MPTASSRRASRRARWAPSGASWRPSSTGWARSTSCACGAGSPSRRMPGARHWTRVTASSARALHSRRSWALPCSGAEATMSIPRLAIQRPVGVAMLVVALVFLGALSASRLPVDLLPDIAYPKLVVYTSYPDVAPAEVERFVTEPVEQQVATVPGVER